MRSSAKWLAVLTAVAMTATGCGSTTATSSTASTTAAAASTTAAATTEAGASSLKLDNTKWQYDDTNKVYWQIGLQYCTTPEDTDYETMGIYVPAAYMTAKDNGDGTYTCSINQSGSVGDYTAATAPMVIPVETPGYAAYAARRQRKVPRQAVQQRLRPQRKVRQLR